jgi:perosamine synthetase
VTRTQYKIPLARPSFSRTDLREAFALMRKSIESGWLTSGPVTEEFERTFATYVGTKHAIAVNSGTAALHAIMLACNLRQGDEVIVPANTFVATANAVLFVGAKPVLVDSDRNSFNISVEAARKAISSKTKAIVCVHLAGNPCDMDALREISDENGLLLIEDAAHAHGAQYRGKKAGSLGHAAAFSFYPTKIITTGEGGMITTDSEDVANHVRAIRNHGRLGYGPLEVTRLGYNFRMSDINAALGVVQLKHLDRYVRHRNRLASIYREMFESDDRVKVQEVRDNCVSSYYSLLVRLRGRHIARDRLMAMLADAGIETSVMYKPIHWQPYFAEYLAQTEWNLPVSDMLGKSGLALPLFDGMTESEVTTVVDSLLEFCGR